MLRYIVCEEPGRGIIAAIQFDEAIDAGELAYTSPALRGAPVPITGRAFIDILIADFEKRPNTTVREVHLT